MIHTIKTHGFTYEVARFSDGSLAVRRLAKDPCERRTLSFEHASEASAELSFDVGAEVERLAKEASALPDIAPYSDGETSRRPRSSRPKIAVIGISKGASLKPAVKTFTSWKEVCDAYGWTYGAERRAEDENRDKVPMLQVVPAGSVACRLPCPCSRCGKEATLLNVFENAAGTEVYCGFDCYRAAGAT